MPVELGTLFPNGVVRYLVGGLLIGGGVFLLALAAGAYLVYLWRQQRLEPATAGAAATIETDIAAGAETEELREALLLEIAALDDAYEAGEIEVEAYETRRQQLKEELAAIWT